jgi:serine/threonine protein kinase
VAWKRKYCPPKVSSKEQEEIKILKKLRHPHIIDLVGTYTKVRYLGLLLHPVAVTDLWTFLEDLDTLARPKLEHSTEHEQSHSRFRLLQLDEESPVESGKDLLRRRLGCLIHAIEYLHRNKIRHKDLKVSKIGFFQNHTNSILIQACQHTSHGQWSVPHRFWHSHRLLHVITKCH